VVAEIIAKMQRTLSIGLYFTRFQTKFFQGRYGDLDSSLISFGPCQTPTLGFCVQRHDEIQQFKPEAFWFVQVTVEPDLKLEWQRVRIFEKEIAVIFYNIVKDQREAVVEQVSLCLSVFGELSIKVLLFQLGYSERQLQIPAFGFEYCRANEVCQLRTWNWSPYRYAWETLALVPLAFIFLLVRSDADC
jgi:DNA topoisomerase